MIPTVLRATRSTRPLRRWSEYAGSIGVVGLLALGAAAANPGSAGAQNSTETGSPDRPVELAGLGFSAGNSDAPVQVVEFSDFSCPYCRTFHQEIFPTLEAEYVETGKIEWTYVTFVSGLYPNSLAAGATAECAGAQGLFAEMRDLLYATQDQWKRASPREAGSVFESLADQLDLDNNTFRACVLSEEITERIKAASPLAAQVGVRGTPTYVIDGFPAMGALPVDFIRRMLDRRLAEVGSGRSRDP